MQAPLGELDAQVFLRDYWQQRPCVLRGALADFQSPLDGDDLAGLACEPLAESRLILGPDEEDRWELRHGPMEESDFDALGDRNWTLLVQDVEKHYPPLQQLLDRFTFLPSWRLDDLMISFAATGGSVGPHVDQYDVFLLQTMGRRHWSIAERGSLETRADSPIDMLSSFSPEQEWTLEPGDMLYLPPGVAHHGVALEPCMTYSVGFRAPSAADLAMALGEWLAQETDDGGRYRDPELAAWPRPGEISSSEQHRFRALLVDITQDEARFAEFLAAFMSRFRQAHEPMAGPTPPDQNFLQQALRGDLPLQRHPWARAAWVAKPGQQAMLCVSGQAHECSLAMAQAICAPGSLQLPATLEKTDQEVLTALLSSGQILMQN